MPAIGNVALLPEIDAEFLEEKGFDYEIVQATGEVRVIIHGYSFPGQYTPRSSNLMLRLPAGYPNANPDMFWTNPDVKLTNGAYDNSWRGGVDNLRTKLASVRRELEKGR